ncbi:MAG: TonB-dependent receptor [Proteobacteria bacterium]|nr:TonB-dependent receptor [Pseudomonadota bacterium]
MNSAKHKIRGGLHAAAVAPARRIAPSKLSIAIAASLAALVDSSAIGADLGQGLGGELQAIVVTARKRQENLQDVPVSIDVFTQRDLKNLAINSLDDYVEKVPSMSFISTGPGTQLFVMRGVSDGSNPTYANTSSTGFFVDDLSMGQSGGQPDLHLYDIERIEVLNGPQGTTFGAGAMSGAVRYITNKPDLSAFSAGVDFDAGQIHGGQRNWTYEGFLNLPIINGVLGMRVSAFSDSHGGFINNRLVTRTWVNGAVSDNAPWAHDNYNRENIVGGRVALKAAFGENWSALLSYGFQRQHTNGAWDQDPLIGRRAVARFGPESNQFEAKMLDLHVDGDVGIGDLVFASTYWAQPRRQWNEYSQYEQNYNVGAKNTPPSGFPGTQEGFACLTDPYYGNGAPYSGCNPALQFYSYDTNPELWSNELRLSSKPGGRFHWLAGLYWEKDVDHYGSTFYMPGLQYNGQAFQSYLQYYGLTQPTLPPGIWYSYRTNSKSRQSTEFANISFDVTDRLNVEAGVVHFKSSWDSNTPFVQFAYATSAPSTDAGDSHKWNGKLGINYRITDHAMVYADFAQGFREGGANNGYTDSCYASGVPHAYTPDTLNNFELGWKTTSLQNRLLWNGAAYYMDWKNLQTLLYNPLVCPSSSYNVNIGQARIYGMESNIDFRISESWSMQAAANYTDSHLISPINASYAAYSGERLPFAPYFSWSWNLRYEQPLGGALRGYAQFDMAHKGDMWNGLNPEDKNLNLPRILQPAYTLMNLRVGFHPAQDERWLAELYVTNLTDKNAVVFSNSANFDIRQTVTEPRVIGLRMSFRFGKQSPSAGE